MKTRLWTVWMAVSGLGLASCGGALQPGPACVAGHGGWAAKYTPKPGQSLTGACAAKHGEILGVQTYYGSTRALEKVALKSATLTALEDTANVGLDPDHPIISFGDFSQPVPDESHFCSVPTFSAAEQHLPADGADPAVDIRYQFSNARLYVTAASPGQQMSAELEYSENGCTGKYDVTALYPAVDCGVTDPDTGEYLMNGDKFQVDESLCTHSNAYGRSIQPTYPVRCDADTHLCVLDGAVPSFQAAATH